MGERARLVADLDRLLPTAVEEMLRYTSPVANFQRTVMADTTLRDVELREGDRVVVFYGSANRDEDVFTDPDRFDVGRYPNPHLAFGGGGPHLCLGMHVARIEIADRSVFDGAHYLFDASATPALMPLAPAR